MPAPKRSLNVSGDWPANKKKKRNSDAAEPHGRPLGVQAEEEFTRGRGSALTHLEKRQLEVKAKQDVLFEQQPGAQKRGLGDDQSSGDEQPNVAQTPARKHRKLPTRPEKLPTNEKIDRARGLTSKRLTPGSQVLGRIVDITYRGIVLSLSNNLSGYVQLSTISNAVTAQEEQLDDASVLPLLSGMFHRGQLLRACVIANTDSDRRIDLSIEPHVVNKGLRSTDLVRHSMVQAEVTAVEDHGLAVSLGIENSDITGFISAKELNKQDPDAFHIGTVLLCHITENVKDSRVAKLSVDEERLWNASRSGVLKDAPSIDMLMPGVAVEFTVTEVTPTGVLGSAMGIAKTSIETLHSGSWLRQQSLTDIFTVGKKYVARLIWKLYEDGEATLGLSFLDHLLRGLKEISHLALSQDFIPDLRSSSIIDQAKILQVEPKLGVFLDLGPGQPSAFVHISRISDEKIQQLSGSSGPYAVGSIHRCRLLGFNTIDMVFVASMEQSTIDLPYLRVEDLEIGERVKGTVDKFVARNDETVGLVVNITDSISGMAAKLHLSDVRLEHPERKFKPGSSVTCRVLAIDLAQKRLKLTLKKSLVNSEAPIWQSFQDVTMGVQVPGTLVSFVKDGAIIQFYGELRGFLPVSQMSEAYLTDAEAAFRLGQVISVRALSLDTDNKRLVLTCRDQGGLDDEQQQALSELAIGAIVEGSVVEKSKDTLVLRLKDYGLKARLAYDHLTDGSANKVEDESKRTRIGQTFKKLVVLQKNMEQSFVRVTSKKSLREAFKIHQVPHSMTGLTVGKFVTGYINNVTPTGVFVSFAGDLTGLIPQSRLLKIGQDSLKEGLRKNVAVDCRIDKLDVDNSRLLLDFKSSDSAAKVEVTSKSPGSYSLGQLVRATVVSRKETQLNVELPGGAQGRVDVSEAFACWEDIKDRKYPLRQFHLRQELPVRVLGLHDSRNHRFLPITHTGKAPVFELSARSAADDSLEKTVLSLDQVKTGSKWMCFVNNVKDNCLWVNLSPNIRGRIDALNVSKDTDMLVDLAKNYPVGSAIRATVTHVDASSNRLDLSAIEGTAQTPNSILDLSVGSILPAKVTKVTGRQVFVQLSGTISGPIHITDLKDDFSAVSLESYHKGQIMKVCVTSIDTDKNRLGLSGRASRVENDADPVVDKEVTDLAQVKANDVLRGFIKSPYETGLFVSLSSTVDAFVLVRDISDAFLKDWQSRYALNELVQGKVISVEPKLKRVQMSLKASVLDKNYKPPITYNDVKEGDVFAGKVRRVEEFGAFIVLDNSNNVSGLCHRSQMANERVRNAKDILEDGDKVTVKVVKVDSMSKKISLSLKSSFGKADAGTTQPVSNAVQDDASDSSEHEEDAEDAEDAEEVDYEGLGLNLAESYQDIHQSMAAKMATGPGLTAGAFDWSGNTNTNGMDAGFESDSAASAQNLPRTKRKKSQIKVDKTADLDVNGPQSVADFERRLLGQPNSSYLWLAYMAYQLQHGEIDKTRAVAERAVRTINHQSQDTAADALNAWIAYLNLENAHGDADAVEAVFNRACEVNDPQEIHNRLVSIYIQSGNLDKADALLNKMIKSFSQDPKVWINYATFLFDSVGSPARGRDLLERALQTLPKNHHVEVTLKFAQIEYLSEKGEAERGRTLFEGLSASFPKRLDIWNVRLDQEIRLKDFDQVRRIFTRVTQGDLKPKKALKFFKRWRKFERAHGQEHDVAKVDARAAEYVKLRESEGGVTV